MLNCFRVTRYEYTYTQAAEKWTNFLKVVNLTVLSIYSLTYKIFRLCSFTNFPFTGVHLLST